MPSYGPYSSFWSGVLFLLLVVFSRFFEYETGLMVKSIVLIAAGVSVIYRRAAMNHISNKGGRPVRKYSLFFCLAVVFQVALLAWKPAYRIYTLLVGRAACLKPVPVDPFLIGDQVYEY